MTITSYNIWRDRNLCPKKEKSPRAETKRPNKSHNLSMESRPDNLPLPDLYLIDSHKLLKEVSRIRHLMLCVPVTEASHSAAQTVIDALWRMESNMIEILKVHAAMQTAFREGKKEVLGKDKTETETPRVGLRVIS